MAYTLEEFLKLNKGYTKDWNPDTNMASVTNTNTGKSINFQSGQGQEYGLGGIENQSNVIADLNKFNTALGINNISTPPTAMPPESAMDTSTYSSPYADQISSTLASISNRPAFSYDPSTDQGLQAAQENAMSAVSREAARRGMIYSDSNKSQLGKSSMALIPQFQDVAYNQYNQQGNDMYNQLNALSGLETQNYNKYIDQTNMANSEQERARNEAISTLGQYSNNYMARYNEVMNDSDPTNDWQGNYLMALRQDKIANQGLDQQGNALPVAQGMVSAQAQEALNAYNAGFRTPEVMNILTSAGYQFPVASGSGSGSATTSPTNAPTNDAQYMVNYNKLANQINVPSYNGTQMQNTVMTPMQFVENIARNYDIYVNDYTKQVVDDMINNLYAQMNPQQLTTDELIEKQKLIQLMQENKPQAPEEVDYTATTKPYTDHISDKFVTRSDGENVYNTAGIREYIASLLTSGQIEQPEGIYLYNLYELGR